jgi:hypothetical protein
VVLPHVALFITSIQKVLQSNVDEFIIGVGVTVVEVVVLAMVVVELDVAFDVEFEVVIV